MERDWHTDPTYRSERIVIDGTLSPVVLYDMKLPRQLEDAEIALMLSIADFHLDRGLPFIALVRHRRGTGVIPARHREAFADWLELRRERLQRDDVSAVVSMPEAIFRAVMRVVYRFRAPPLRTITTSDMEGAAEAVRKELLRIERPITPEIEALLERLNG
jgi:hypothetical protein